ncbi:MAG: hypothetical protein AAFQ32_04525 [Pseudomonadota bacterium]
MDATEFRVGDWVTWGTKSSAFKIERIEDNTAFFDKPHAVYMRSFEPHKLAVPQSVSIHDCVGVDELNNLYISQENVSGSVKSDGGSSSYYSLPEDASELNDLIEHKQMSFARGNLFKALYRLGNKEGTDVEYDLNKMEYFLERLRKMHSSGVPL